LPKPYLDMPAAPDRVMTTSRRIGSDFVKMASSAVPQTETRRTIVVGIFVVIEGNARRDCPGILPGAILLPARKFAEFLPRGLLPAKPKRFGGV